MQLSSRRKSAPTSTLPILEKSKLLLLALLLFPYLAAGQATEDPIVQAILFYSPTCPHCHEVLKEILIPIQDQYGHQLQIIGIDTSHPDGKEFFLRVTQWFEVPQNRRGVPTLVVGDTVLVSSSEIAAQFPRLLEDGLSAGGIGWPDIPDLSAAIPDLPPSAAPGTKPEAIIPAEANSEKDLQDSVPQAVPTGEFPGSAMMEDSIEQQTAAPTQMAAVVPMAQSLENMDLEATSPKSEVLQADPVGFILAWSLLFGMSIALIFSARQILIAWKSLPLVSSQPAAYTLPWAVLILALVGLGIALYLSYVEIAQVEAICGPVGQCNIVQTSPYARLLGIPIAVLGALSYIAIIGLWVGQRIAHGRVSTILLLGICIVTVLGTGFSIYLTLIELLAIEAICAWCLLSAVLMTLLMVLAITTLTKRPSKLE